MDDLAEGFIRGIWRTIGYVLGQVLFEFVFYYIGWPFVKIMTLGKYPQGKTSRGGWHTETREGTWSSLVGILVTVAVIMGYVQYYSLT